VHPFRAPFFTLDFDVLAFSLTAFSVPRHQQGLGS
jgi:hypothetical protein